MYYQQHCNYVINGTNTNECSKSAFSVELLTNNPIYKNDNWCVSTPLRCTSIKNKQMPYLFTVGTDCNLQMCKDTVHVTLTPYTPPNILCALVNYVSFNPNYSISTEIVLDVVIKDDLSESEYDRLLDQPIANLMFYTPVAATLIIRTTE